MAEWYEEFGAPTNDPVAYKKWLQWKKGQDSKKRISEGTKMNKKFTEEISQQVLAEFTTLAKLYAQAITQEAPCTCPLYTDKPHVSDEEMTTVLEKIMHEFGDTKELPYVNFDEFKKGFNEELEHGCRSPATNITCDDHTATAKIVLAHLKENATYYTKLFEAGI